MDNPPNAPCNEYINKLYIQMLLTSNKLHKLV